MKTEARTIASLFLFTLLLVSQVPSVLADCSPQATNHSDSINCAGDDTDGVDAQAGHDTISILPGASITLDAQTTGAETIAVDAGAGNDEVDNDGVISLTVADEGSGSANPQCGGTNGTSTAKVTGVSGGSGDDSLKNSGVLTVDTTRTLAAAAGASSSCQSATHGSKHAAKTSGTTASESASSVGISGDSGNDTIENVGSVTVTEQSASIAQPVSATGISGGDGNDVMVNGGTIAVTASAVEDNTALLAPAPIAAQVGNDDVATASVVGIAGGNGKDAISNDGTITVDATARIDGVSPALTLGGGDDVDASTTVGAHATGIAAGDGKDGVANNGDVSASATAEVNNVAVEVNLIDLSHADTSTTINSTAIGIDGGKSNDTLGVGNSGSVNATATSRSSSVAVEANLIDAAVSDATLEVNSDATGIDTGSGHNQVNNAGSVNATATSEVSDVGVNVSFIDATIAEGAMSDIATTLNASAVGINSSKGRDDLAVTSTGGVTATATSSASSVGVSLASEGVPGSTADLLRDEGLARIGITSNSDAVGLATSRSRDHVTTDGDVTVSATSEATQASINVGIAAIDFHVPTPGVVLGGAGTRAESNATGISTGGGDDTVTNTARTNVNGDATASATTVSVNIAEISADPAPNFPSAPPVGASLVVADTATEAVATTTGIDAGSGNDVVDNAGVVESTANANGGSTGASATLDVKYEDGDNFFALDFVGARSTTNADATAVGITGGDGRDQVTNSDRTSATANADGNTVAVSVVVSGTLNGAGGALNLAATDTSTNATATSTGIAGGEGRDTITNIGTTEAISVADVDGVNVGVSATVAEQGLVAGVALSRSVSEATATSVGIGDNDGEDVIDNTASGTVTSNATADAGAIAVSVKIDGTTRGVAGGAALTDARTIANADATGIRAGVSAYDGKHDRKDEDKDGHHGTYDKYEDERSLTNAGAVNVDAQAHTHSVSVSADVAVAGKGVAIGVALANTSTNATATALGIQTDDNDNMIDNSGAINVKSGAGSTAVSVSLSIAGTTSGLAAGAALTDSSVTVSSTAQAIDAGRGDDIITNSGAITFDQAESRATAVSVSLSEFLAQNGVAVGAALGRTEANATTSATAIDGGKGDDKITNRHAITMDNVNAHADAVGVSLGVSLAQNGVGISGSLVDGDSTATVDVTALEGGRGDDALTNTGTVQMRHGNADADAVSVAVNAAAVVNGVPLGGALVDADALAELEARALSGGSGNDYIVNKGTIAVEDMKSNSDAVGVSASLTVAQNAVSLSAAFALTGAEANTTVSGVDGGDGEDFILNADDPLGEPGSANISLKNIESEADAVGVSVGLSGGASGLFIGASVADGSGEATTRASAIDAGEGNDVVINKASILVDDVGSDAHATGVTVGAAGASAGVAAGVSIANTSGVANTWASGIDGGDGANYVKSEGDITLRQVRSHADAVSVGVSLGVTLAGGVAGGVSLADASATATTDAVGIDGGDEASKVFNSGAITLDDVESTTKATGVSAQIGITNAGLAIGGALVDSRNTATTNARAMNGSDSNDLLVNTGSVLLRDIDSNAGATSVGVTVNGAVSGGVAGGVSLTDASSHSNTTAIGMDGGDGEDHIVNSGEIRAEDVTSTARATGVSVSIQVSAAGVAAGASIADTSGSATTRVSGIDGGAGNDTLQNDGVVNVAGAANANALSLAIGGTGALGLGAGAQLTNAEMTADTSVTGLDGGLGRDQITNTADVTAAATSETKSAAISVGVTVAVGGDASLANATTTSTAKAVGIDGGETATDIKKYPHKKKHRHEDDDDHYRSDGYKNSDDKYEHEKEEEGDIIVNSGAISAEAESTGKGTTAGANLIGFALGELTNTSAATSIGIRTGDAKDLVLNDGSINAFSKASASGLAVGATLAGKAMGDVSTTADSSSSGIATGDGRDQIENSGAITLDARANASANGVSVGAIGVSDANASVTALANGVGIDAGDGKDTIINFGAISVSSGLANEGTETSASCPDIIKSTTSTGSCARSSQVSVQVAGAGFIDAKTEAHSSAIGIDGADADDTIYSDAVVKVNARAKTAAGSTNVSVLGAALSDARTLSDSDAVGISGGDGADLVSVLGEVDARASSHIVLSGKGFNLAGVADFDATLDANAKSSAIDGGDGADTITNSATLTSRTRATVSSGGSSTAVFGASNTGGRSGAIADSAGIRGGTEDDFISNTGVITTHASSDLVLSSTAFTFGGASGTDGELTATTIGSGIRGDEGRDKIINSGEITVNAVSTQSARSGSTVVFGGGSAGAESGAVTDATGIAGGADDDYVHNSANVTINSTATLSLTGGSFTLGGGSTVSGELTATTRSAALSGGSGKDVIKNEGELRVTNTSTMTSNSSSKVGFGSATANSNAGSLSEGNGIDGGDDDDLIWNIGKIFVTTTANLSLGSSTYTFGGTGNAGGRLNATTHAVGIYGGSGNDRLTSEGDIEVTANSTLSTSGRVNTTFGTAPGGAVIATNIGAVGIDGGDGDDWIRNQASIIANSTVSSSSTTTSYVFGGSASSLDVAEVSSSTAGLRGGNGHDIILNDGDVEASANASISQHGSAHAEFGSSNATSRVVSRLDARGVDGGAGDDVFVNMGNITSRGTSSASMTQSTNTGIFIGSGSSRARATTTISAFAVDLGEGDNVVENTGDIVVDLYGTASADTYSDGADLINGDAFSRSDSVVSATAIGVRTGSGNDLIENAGSIEIDTWRKFEIVLPPPPVCFPPIIPCGPTTITFERALGASADAEADGDGIDGDGTIRSNATTNLTVIGIDAGHGNNEIHNSGDINIDARARANATGTVDSDLFGSSDARLSTAINARAYGILSGDGDDYVVNTGTITVTTNGSKNTSAGSFSVIATGIDTGAGNDTIINDGTITATRIVNGSTSRGTAINAGAGDDVVKLLDGSVTNGNVDLGSGNDLLSLEGTPIINGGFLGTSSSVSLEFNNSGSFAGGLPGVRAIKNGEGTFSLTMLNQMEYIEVNGGTLKLENDYDFLPDGLLLARVFGDGSGGRFYVNGAAGLEGDVKVMRGGGAYHDGTSYEIFRANSVKAGTSFNSVEMPEATPLLEFSSQQTGDSIQVSASVASFTKVADSPNQMAVASNLDRVLPTVTGDLNQVMGEIQALPGGHAAAFASLSPEVYARHSDAALGSAGRYSGVLNERITALFNSQLARSETGRRPVVVAQGGSALADVTMVGETQNTRRSDLWLRAFWQDGERDASSDVTGFDYDTSGLAIGIDRAVSNHVTLGLSFAAAGSDVATAGNLSSSDIDSRFFSAYSGYFNERFYANGTLSFGRNEYDSRRNLVVGATTTPLTSSHEGSILTASIGVGRYYPLAQWWVDPFAYLQYTRLDEDGFTESGSGAGLIVGDRVTDALVSTLGARLSRMISTENGGTWIPEASLAWVHDFAIDDELINASYIDAPDATFSIANRSVEKNGYTVGLGLGYRTSSGLSSLLRYSGDFRSEYKAHSVAGEVHWEF